jgi:hypothetical protein
MLTGQIKRGDGYGQIGAFAGRNREFLVNRDQITEISEQITEQGWAFFTLFTVLCYLFTSSNFPPGGLTQFIHTS